VSATERHRGPLLLALGLSVLASAAVTLLLAGPVATVLSRPTADGYDVDRMVLVYATLPRLVIALLCGAGLGASGAILQQVLRNPLASPTTLGIDAGARLALALATLFTPSLLGIGRDLVALSGSAISTLFVFALVRRRGLTALSLVLAGLVVSLYCGALAALLVLLRDRLLVSLFIWGGGSLSQQSWEPSAALAVRLAIVAVPLLLLLRPLSLMDLGDESVRALGLSATRLRVAAVTLAAALAAFVTSAVGVIGFVGLVAPIIARLSGARRFGEQLLWSTAMGALLLLLTDAVVQMLAGATSEFVPTGAVTAVLGSPLLLLLLPRLKTAAPPPSSIGSRSPTPPSLATALAALAACVLLVTVTILVGRGASGEWQILSPDHWEHVVTWRLPRLSAAASAGALLGVAGLILQRLTGNLMASPEVLGVSAGAILAVAISLFTFGAVAGVSQSLSATIGGIVVLGLILVLGSRSSFAPERVLLAGIALNALIDAVVGVLSATGDPRAIVLLGWMSGSTAGATGQDAMHAGVAAVPLIAASLLATRWLAILPLGGPQAKALGVPLGRARFLLLILAAAMTAAATPVIGPLTFVGLMAPHIVLTIGIRQPVPALLSAAAAGGAVMAVADWLARTVAFPIQLPTGLVAAMAGAPFLMTLLNRRSASS
jgi:ferric hydroxamate transport system permease protein